jgi:hypothetical protein
LFASLVLLIAAAKKEALEDRRLELAHKNLKQSIFETMSIPELLILIIEISMGLATH